MKKRPDSHIVDSVGQQLLRQALPDEWVVREYKPDYGVDFAVEVFDSVDGTATSLGDHFFVQLKSHKDVARLQKRVFARYNIEKSALTYDRNNSSDIDVIVERLELPELQLARSMGPAVPLLLVVADIGRSEVYWVCLNDFVDKVLVPEVGDLSAQSTHAVYIPIFNKMDRSDGALAPLRFLARRAKLYAAFNRFRYQRHEIQYALDRYERHDADDPADPELLRLAQHFLDIVLAYDFWTTTHTWPAIEVTHRHAEATSAMISSLRSGAPLESIFADRLADVEASEGFKAFVRESLVSSDIMATFSQLANLGNLFEEICREWFLPTHLGSLADRSAIG